MRFTFILTVIIAAAVLANAQSTHTLELFNGAVESAKGGDHETAEKRFAEVAARISREGAPNRFFALAHYNLGVSRYHRRQLAEAYGDLEKALRYSNRMHPRAHYVMGLIRFELHDLKGAESSLRTAIALSQSDDAEIWYDLAFVHLAAGDNDGAKKAFAAAADLNASGAAASRNNLGVLLAREGRLAAAMAEFETAARTDRTGTAAANLEKCRRFVDNSSVAGLRFAGRRADTNTL